MMRTTGKNRMIKKAIGRYTDNTDGSTAVEFGLIAIGFLAIIFGVIDAGRAVMALNAMQNGLESSTRYVIVNRNATEQEITDVIKADMGGFTLAANDINVSVTYDTVSGIDFVEISATYQFTPLVTSFLPDSWATLNLPSSARTPLPAED